MKENLWLKLKTAIRSALPAHSLRSANVLHRDKILYCPSPYHYPQPKRKEHLQKESFNNKLLAKREAGIYDDWWLDAERSSRQCIMRWYYKPITWARIVQLICQIVVGVRGGGGSLRCNICEWSSSRQKSAWNYLGVGSAVGSGSPRPTLPTSCEFLRLLRPKYWQNTVRDIVRQQTTEQCSRSRSFVEIRLDRPGIPCVPRADVVPGAQHLCLFITRYYWR